jgi:hypothetical protein
MAEFIQGSAPTAVMALIQQGAIKDEFVAEIFQYLMRERMQMSINMGEFRRKINEMELQIADFQREANNYTRTITQTRENDTNRRENDSCEGEDNGGGESKTSGGVRSDEVRSGGVRSDGVRSGEVRSDGVRSDEVQSYNLTEDDKTILRENFTQEFGWDVPPNKKNDFPWIIEKITNSKKYREEYHKRQRYRINRQARENANGETERNSTADINDKEPWRP